jgi:hypothetical protein
MNEGLLWADFDKKRDLADKVTRAADRYRVKFGRRPNLCYVHESAVGNGTLEFDGVRVVGAHNTLKHHFWIGVENEQELREAA